MKTLICFYQQDYVEKERGKKEIKRVYDKNPK
jgi:hypothetical protein